MRIKPLFFKHLKATITAIGCTTLICCSAGNEFQNQSPPNLELVEHNSPPERGGGDVRPIKPSAESDNKECYYELDIPEEGGYYLDDQTLESTIETRLYVDELYADASLNFRICEIWVNTLWSNLEDSENQLHNINEERSTWWYRNKETFFFGAGFTLGVSAAILTVYGLNNVQ